jgi:hypothetical protein
MLVDLSDSHMAFTNPLTRILHFNEVNRDVLRRAIINRPALDLDARDLAAQALLADIQTKDPLHLSAAAALASGTGSLSEALAAAGYGSREEAGQNFTTNILAVHPDKRLALDAMTKTPNAFWVKLAEQEQNEVWVNDPHRAADEVVKFIRGTFTSLANPQNIVDERNHSEVRTAADHVQVTRNYLMSLYNQVIEPLNKLANGIVSHITKIRNKERRAFHPEGVHKSLINFVSALAYRLQELKALLPPKLKGFGAAFESVANEVIAIKERMYAFLEAHYSTFQYGDYGTQPFPPKP